MAFFFKRETSPSLVMSLFPYEDVLTKEIESWKGFADRLPIEEDRKVFMEMFNNCYKYAKAINAMKTKAKKPVKAAKKK
jgi:hypothetical protein